MLGLRSDEELCTIIAFDIVIHFRGSSECKPQNGEVCEVLFQDAATPWSVGRGSPLRGGTRPQPAPIIEIRCVGC